jgi:cell shape-determining protein MreC
MKTTFICLLLGLALALLPSPMQATIRDVVSLVFRPGQELASDGLVSAKSAWANSFDAGSAEDRDQIDQLRTELKIAKLDARKNQLAAEQWRTRWQTQRRHGTSPFERSNSHPLIVAQAIDARIIGQNVVSLWKSDRLLNAGTTAGVADDQWVLDNAEFKIDQGQATGVLSGLPVFAGRCIVGRIAKSGRWTSSLELISSRSFRSKAVIGAAAKNTLEFLLEGNGDDACLLTQVPITEPVEVGSPVYSVAGDRAIDGPMLFGFIETAERRQGSLHWNIVVRPAAAISDLETVQVVTATLNPDRLVGQR